MDDNVEDSGDHSSQVAQILRRLVPEGTTITRNDLAPQSDVTLQPQWSSIDNLPYRDHRMFAAEALKSFDPHPHQVQPSDAIDLSIRGSHVDEVGLAEGDMEEDTVSSCDPEDSIRHQQSEVGIIFQKLARFVVVPTLLA